MQLIFMMNSDSRLWSWFQPRVIPGRGGCRIVRWPLAGTGKRGGVRIVYSNRLAAGGIWLLVTYTARALRECSCTYSESNSLGHRK